VKPCDAVIPDDLKPVAATGVDEAIKMLFVSCCDDVIEVVAGDVVITLRLVPVLCVCDVRLPVRREDVDLLSAVDDSPVASVEPVEDAVSDDGEETTTCAADTRGPLELVAATGVIETVVIETVVVELLVAGDVIELTADDVMLTSESIGVVTV